ncbi:hypothetical protein AVEN_204948-1 [Araneus ventricosus]|uniref:Uncharacterized protein n=1 Tax=Araneus ventricosus TaxID=182803 RepID=A0A4Y2TYV5_ARAVE|nr:hypothetical protein AVEN_17327-1 [Araneus ventricosus]GBO04527.1 hypothetical protein AVEN_204948-1 [Araneus ventricosus]
MINHLSTAEPDREDNTLVFFTDSFKTEMGTGCSYCAFENGIKVLECKGKLERFHTVFQTELVGQKEAIIWLGGSKPMLATRVMKKPILSPKKPSQKALW